MVAPRLSTGQEVPLCDWNGMQVDRATQWEITREMSPSDRVLIWAQFFAQVVGDLCKKHGVPVDVVRDAYPDLAQRLIPHIDRLKWLQSELEQRDVGLEETAKRIRWSIYEKVEGELKRVKVVAMLPNLRDPDSVHEEGMEMFMPATPPALRS